LRRWVAWAHWYDAHILESLLPPDTSITKSTILCANLYRWGKTVYVPFYEGGAIRSSPWFWNSLPGSTRPLKPGSNLFVRIIICRDWRLNGKRWRRKVTESLGSLAAALAVSSRTQDAVVGLSGKMKCWRSSEQCL
jgi:hypothetical protein